MLPFDIMTRRSEQFWHLCFFFFFFFYQWRWWWPRFKGSSELCLLFMSSHSVCVGLQCRGRGSAAHTHLTHTPLPACQLGVEWNTWEDRQQVGQRHTGHIQQHCSFLKAVFSVSLNCTFWVSPPDACYYVKGAVHPKKLNIQSQSSLLDRDGKSEVLLSTKHFWSSTSKQRCNIFLNSWSRRSLKRKQWNVSQEACVVSLGSFRIPHWFEDVISTLFTQHL